MKGLPQPAVGGTNQTNAEVEEAVEEVGAWFELVPACPYPPKESRRHLSRKKNVGDSRLESGIMLLRYVFMARGASTRRKVKRESNVQQSSFWLKATF